MKVKFSERIRGAIRGFKEPKSTCRSYVWCGREKMLGATCENNAPCAIYLCDGEDPRCACYLKDEFCQHTTDISHARNFKNAMYPGETPIWVELDEEDKVTIPDA